MDLSNIPLDNFIGQGIFCLLFVWLLFTTNKQSLEREQRLTDQINKQNEAQEKIVQSLERLETQISDLVL
ncbi:BhlA/UviB family holin-like peptide [Heyndrickxia sporothermodurans]|uniref:BhlA/UviB family holin-like peptide n=1 Tax=Heyndrickxia sporothermodurans TaxID=46224 RepID=UPI003D238A10